MVFYATGYASIQTFQSHQSSPIVSIVIGLSNFYFCKTHKSIYEQHQLFYEFRLPVYQLQMGEIISLLAEYQLFIKLKLVQLYTN